MTKKNTADMVKDYLKSHFYIDEFIPQYENPDGRIMYFINKHSVRTEIAEEIRKEIKECSNEEYHEHMMNIFEDMLKHPKKPEEEKSTEFKLIEGRYHVLKNSIAEEEGKAIAKFAEKKFYESVKLQRTKGFFKTIEDMLGEKDENKKYIFDEWQKENTPHLYKLEQGIYVEDFCKSEPKCGFCGDYIFLRKKTKTAAEQLITNLEQYELIDDDITYIFGENADRNSPEVRRFTHLMVNRLGKPFRDRFNAAKLTKQVDNKTIDVLENWEVYENIRRVKEEFESQRGK